MKKSTIVIALLAIVLATASSCNKCTTCSKSGGSTSTICRNSYNSTSDYNAAVYVYENTGWTCN